MRIFVKVAGGSRLCARASAGDAGACRGAGAAPAFAPAVTPPTTPASDFANPLRFRLIRYVSMPCFPEQTLGELFETTAPREPLVRGAGRFVVDVPDACLSKLFAERLRSRSFSDPIPRN